MAAYEVLLLNTAIPQIQAAQSGDTYVVPRDIQITANLDVTGNTILGDASTDTVRVNGYMGVGGAGTANAAVYLTSTALTGTSQYGFYSTPRASSAATSQAAGFTALVRTEAAAFTLANAYGLSVENVTKGAGSTITNQHGVYISDQTQGTNNYGVTSAVSSGGNKWNIYASGTADNYFAGNVGIGTSNPAQKLHVATTVGNAYMRVERASQSAGQVGLQIAGGTSSTEWFMYIPTSSNTLTWFGNSTNLMSLDTSGNLGIGTTLPATKLHVSATTPVIRIDATAAYNASPTSTLSFVGTYNSGNGLDTFASISAVKANATSGDGSAYLAFSTNTSTGNLQEKVRITSGGTTDVTANINASIALGQASDDPYVWLDRSDGGSSRLAWRIRENSSRTLIFETGSSASKYGQTFTEAAQITSAGDVNIGNGGTGTRTLKIQTNTSGDPTLNLTAAGVDLGSFWFERSTSRLYARSSNTGGVYLAAGGTSWTAVSDERKKDIIEPITDAASKVSTLRAVIGKYKTDEDGKRRSFLIAQDVQAVLPEAVDATNSDELGLSYSDMIPLLVAAIKEQQAMINDLKAKVASLGA